MRQNWQNCHFWQIFLVEYPGEPVPGSARFGWRLNRPAMDFNQKFWPTESSNKWASCGPKCAKNPVFGSKNGQTGHFWAIIARPFAVAFVCSKLFFNQPVQTLSQYFSFFDICHTLRAIAKKLKICIFQKSVFWGFSIENPQKSKKFFCKKVAPRQASIFGVSHSPCSCAPFARNSLKTKNEFKSGYLVHIKSKFF